MNFIFGYFEALKSAIILWLGPVDQHWRSLCFVHRLKWKCWLKDQIISLHWRNRVHGLCINSILHVSQLVGLST